MPDEIADPSPEVVVRKALECGRLLRSAGEHDRALSCFEQVASYVEQDGLEGLHVDALHMLAMALPPDLSVAAHLEALAVARAGGPDARRWEASLLSNLGMAHHDNDDLPATLRAFEEAVAVREREGDPGRTRVARWMVCWALRLLGRIDEAVAVQRRLKEALGAAGEDDP